MPKLINKDFTSQEIESWGLRPDGTPKGLGWLGVFENPSGGLSSELTVSANVDGKDIYFPLLIPGLSDEEIDKVLLSKEIPEDIFQKALNHAMMRISSGMSPYKD